MKKKVLSYATTFFFLCTYASKAQAHTISQHLQELYGQAYMPLFILARLFPFIGLGLLAPKAEPEKSRATGYWPLFASLGAGLILGFFLSVPDFVIIINKSSILFIGFVLFFPSQRFRIFKQIMMATIALTIGIEYGLSISQASEFGWLHILLLITGLLLFHLTNMLKLNARNHRSTYKIVAACSLILAGLIVVLLT
jgi:hypothetical protein